MTIEITKREARRLFLASQGLLKKNSFGRGKNAVQRVVEQLSYVQIDTISVVERAHHHVLRTRVEDYKPLVIDHLQRCRRSIFEYWFHAAAYLPIKDYRYYLPLMESFAANHQVNSKLATSVLERIRQEGPLKARDFADPGHSSTGWWNWKPAKMAMEYLFRSGEIMVSHREGFQKVYDTRDRVLPDRINTVMPDNRQWLRFQVRLMLKNLGLATEREIIYRRGRLFGADLMPGIKSTLTQLLEEGEILEIKVEGTRYFATPDSLKNIPQRLGSRRIHLLSPFDNLIIQRARTRLLFDFDYQLECYLPANKRQYGYFALPLLWGDRLVGRLDTKAERKAGIFHIYAIDMEQGSAQDSHLAEALATYLQKFAQHNGCNTIRVHQTLTGALKGKINSSAI